MSRPPFRDFMRSLPAHSQRLNAGLIRAHVEKQKVDAEKFDAMMRAAAAPKAEKDLQNALLAILRNREIVPIRQRMDRPSQLELGMPDVMFCVLRASGHPGITSTPHPIAWEAKMPGEKPRPEQIAMHIRLERNGWDVRVITSAAQALDHLAEISQNE